TRFSSGSSFTYCSDLPFLILNRGGGDVNVASLDQLCHMAEEEREQKRADVRSVNVGVGHQNNFAVAKFGWIEIVFADAGSECGNHGAYFFVPEHLVVPGLLHIQNLALQRKNGLEAPITPLLGRTACAFTLDEVELAAVGIALGAVCQFARQSATVQC